MSSNTPFDDAEEPVAWMFDADSYCDHQPIKDCLTLVMPQGIPKKYLKNIRPLFLHPPKPAEPAIRKPMTEEEMNKTMEPWQSRMDVRSDARWGAGFKSGIRFAEKHHGIGGGD